MTRIFLSVGIGTYQDNRLILLPAASADSQRMQDALSDSRFGAYSSNSIRVSDGTLAQVREALRDALSSAEPIDTFTFYFAGHGEYRRGSYFLCCNDTDFDALSQTAFALSELLTILNEARPGHANIIIDACRAGAVAADVAVSLKPDILEPTIGPSISIFASTAAFQAAYENGAGGVATTALLDAIRGTRLIQSTRPFLDLVEIGQFAAREIASTRQSPAVWGLNLSGESQFARNPHFIRVSSDFEPTPASASNTMEIARRIERRSEPLRRIFVDAAQGLATERLEFELSCACEELDPAQGQVSSFVGGFSQSVSMRAAASNDAFAEATTLACCVKILLRYFEQDPGWQETTIDLIGRFSKANRSALQNADRAMAAHRRALMSSRGGISDFFVLPLRLSMILGHLGIEALLPDLVSQIEPLPTEVGRSLVQRILADYAPSLVSVSDAQATHLVHFFGAIERLQIEDACESIFGRYFADFVSHKGMVAKPEITGTEVFNYLVRRAARTKNAAEFAALPSSLLAALMAVAVQLNLDEVVDPFLAEIDHEHANLFIADRCSMFGETLIRDGVNVTLQVGLDNELGFFTTQDFAERFARFCSPRLQRDITLNDPCVRAAALLAAAAFPDRQCWFLLDRGRLSAASSSFTPPGRESRTGEAEAPPVDLNP